MESSHTGWWRRHGWTVALLVTAFGFAFALRTIWTYPLIAQFGALNVYAGGSDSYYHSRVMAYIALNHHNLVNDPMLRFPIGLINPREPLFDWMNGILGVAFAPLFGGNPVAAGAWFLDLQGPLWAALGVFPIYLIGREVAGRRTGLVAALIYPFLSASIDSSIFGYGNYLSFYTFFILVTVYAYIRTVKAVGNRRWVESYKDPRGIVRGLRGFLRTERTAVKWAVFTGVSLGALALAWQGFTYAIVVIGVSVLIAMIAERIRRVDSFGLYVATWIVGLVGFPMAVPYYLVQHQFSVWFDLPLLLYFGVLALLLPFLFLRDVPWVFSIPVLAALVVGAAGVLAVFSPAYFHNIVTGQGYFVKNLIYSTVAEAQAPSIDQLIVGYGVVTFFLTFVGLAIFLYLFVHGRFKRYHVVFLVFALLSIYLPVSAAKFFLIGSPAFALLPAEALVRALDIAGFPELRRTVASLSDRRSQFAAFRKAFKARHVVILVLVVGLVLPNVWVAMDAGIPGNTKGQLSSQVAASLPSWLQPNTSNPSSQYFGAAGSSLDTPNQYDSAGYNWLAQQDTNLPPAKRPALVSWWDYGFQTVAQGQHPSVADNFQNGIDPAGQFLLSQNESQAIGVLITTLLQGEQRSTHLTYLPAGLNRILASDGLNVTELHDLLVNTSADYRLVVAHPERYLPVNPNTLTDDNAMYLAMEYFLATSLPLSGVAKVYNDVQSYTGWSIRYALSDSRLFPFSGQNTGIFYAPADLTGRVISAAGMPVTFFNVTVATTQGTFPAGQVPAGASVLPNGYSINWFAPFYNSMIYHIYVGYNGTDAGLGAGIPGLAGSQQVVGSPLMPGWMLQHFQIVYKTAYYCPRSNATPGSSCYSATNTPTALEEKQRQGGSVDTSPSAYFSGGETMLEYYPGQTLVGRVVLPGGTPVSGVDVTVDDGWGIPHMTARTAADGSFSLVLPPGNDTLNITTGSFDGLRQQGSVLLQSVPIQVPDAVGLAFHAPSLVETYTLAPATVQGFVYWNTANTSAYLPSSDPLVPNAEVVLRGPGNLSVLRTTTDLSGSFRLTNVPPGLYNLSVETGGRTFPQSPITVSAGATLNATTGLLPATFQGVVSYESGGRVLGATVTLGNASGAVATTTTNISGNYAFRSVPPGNYTVIASGPTPGLRSVGVAVSVPAAGKSTEANLTVQPVMPFTLSVSLNGAAETGIPVRFVPVPAYSSGGSPTASLLAATDNGTVLTTGPDGTATAELPAGTYAVYALGTVGGSLYTGTTEVSLLSALSPTSGSLALAPAVRLSGHVAAALPSATPPPTAVIAYPANGGPVTTWAASNGSFAMWLPPGTYSVLALAGTTSAGSSIVAALSSVDLASATSLSLSPVSAVASHFTVGTPLPDGSLLPAAYATVAVAAGANGPEVPVVAGSDGSVTVYVPSVLPDAATYCIRAGAIGFVTTTSCGISPNGMGTLSKFPVSLANVSVHLAVVGLPSGTPARVTLSAESPTAVGRTLSGATTYSFSAPPGVYGVAASATLANGTLYLTSTNLPTTIPVGATYSNLTLYVLPQVLTHGTLSLPAPAGLSDANISLTSPAVSLLVNGSAYTSGFYAPPGVYSAYTNVSVGGIPFANLTQITVPQSGAIATPIDVVAASVHMRGALVDESGGGVPLNATVTLTNTSGASVSVSATNGLFSVSLPPGGPYFVRANGTALSAGPNGSFYRTFTTLPTAHCSVTTTNASCAVPMSGTTDLVWLNGTLLGPSNSGPVSGTVSLLGPYPSANVTEVPAANGSFSLPLLPGAYQVFATGGPSGAAGSIFTSALVLRPGNSLPLDLAPTWTATVQLSPPAGASAGLGPVNLSVRDAYGHRTVVPGLSASAAVTLALPVGSYSLSASASGRLNGVVSSVYGATTITIANGNAGAELALSYASHPAVTGSLLGTTSATVRAGGQAIFSFSVTNTGNVPVTVTPVGAPAYWSFSFSASNWTLAPGQSTSGEVTVGVPAGTAVNHPPVGIEFALANGTVVGSVAPAPSVSVVGYYGVAVGPTNASTPTQVGLDRLVEPFYLTNTGNTYEDVTLSVVDAARLANLGWSATIADASLNATSHAGLNPGQNATFHIFLNATGSIFVAPGSVTVSASVTNASGGVQEVAVLPLAIGTVGPRAPPGGAPLTVQGPSITSGPSPLPDWLVPLLAFVPALALATLFITYRWWRTRKWSRR